MWDSANSNWWTVCPLPQSGINHLRCFPRADIPYQNSVWELIKMIPQRFIPGAWSYTCLCTFWPWSLRFASEHRQNMTWGAEMKMWKWTSSVLSKSTEGALGPVHLIYVNGCYIQAGCGEDIVLGGGGESPLCERATACCSMLSPEPSQHSAIFLRHCRGDYGDSGTLSSPRKRHHDDGELRSLIGVLHLERDYSDHFLVPPICKAM